MESLNEILASLESVGNNAVKQPIALYYLDLTLETISEVRDKEQALRDLKKFHKAAIVHGYRGHSSGGKNGVVDINKTDRHLLEDYQKFLRQNAQYFLNNSIDTRKLQPIKIVAHVPSGNRIIGAIDKNSVPCKVYILGLSNYSGRIA